jgi:hypothetical protein
MPMCDGKKRYGTEQDAVIAASMWEGQRMDKLFWYSCPVCGGFHLTKQAKNNESYFKEKKDELLKKYTNPSKNCFKSVEVTDLIESCKSLDEVVEYNTKHKDNKIALKKAARHFSYDYMVEWNKNNPSHTVNLEWHLVQHAMLLNTKKDATLFEVLTWNKNHPGNLVSLKRFLISMDNQNRKKWNEEHPDLPVPTISKR